MTENKMILHLVIIDRKYNRSNDTGRFELIHKGLPVAVPNYIGIDLRVEGKPCKANRSHNNQSNTNGTNTNTNNTTTTASTVVSAPALTIVSKSSPVDRDSSQQQTTSALDTHDDRSSSKAEEATRRLTDSNDTASSTDSILDKADSSQYRFHSNQMPASINEKRRKQIKIKSNRTTGNTNATHRLNRPKVNDSLPTSKGKKINLISDYNLMYSKEI